MYSMRVLSSAYISPLIAACSATYWKFIPEALNCLMLSPGEYMPSFTTVSCLQHWCYVQFIHTSAARSWVSADCSYCLGALLRNSNLVRFATILLHSLIRTHLSWHGMNYVRSVDIDDPMERPSWVELSWRHELSWVSGRICMGVYGISPISKRSIRFGYFYWLCLLECCGDYCFRQIESRLPEGLQRSIFAESAVCTFYGGYRIMVGAMLAEACMRWCVRICSLVDSELPWHEALTIAVMRLPSNKPDAAVIDCLLKGADGPWPSRLSQGQWVTQYWPSSVLSSLGAYPRHHCLGHRCWFLSHQGRTPMVHSSTRVGRRVISNEHMLSCGPLHSSFD